MRNHIEIHGYLGRDPEYKEYTNSRGERGKLANFSVGVSRDMGDETDWFNVTVFGNRAEVIDKWFQKGSQIIVWGRMESQKYTDKTGIERNGWKILAEGFDFCDKADSPRGQAKQDDIPDSFEEAEGDIPF